MLLTNAQDVNSAMSHFEDELGLILRDLRQGDFSQIVTRLNETAERFARIQMKRPPSAVPTIFLAGEIFVRRDSLSRQHLTEWLAKHGFATICAPVSEWLLYTDFLVKTGRTDCRPTWMDRLTNTIKGPLQAVLRTGNQSDPLQIGFDSRRTRRHSKDHRQCVPISVTGLGRRSHIDNRQRPRRSRQ